MQVRPRCPSESCDFTPYSYITVTFFFRVLVLSLRVYLSERESACKQAGGGAEGEGEAVSSRIPLSDEPRG